MRPPTIEASYFAVVPGLAGLGGAWQAATRAWGVTAVAGEALMLAAGIVWLGLAALYLNKCLLSPGEAVAELEHPVQCCFVGLIGVSMSLVATAGIPYSHVAAQIGISAGAVLTLVVALWLTGRLWRGERDDAATTALLYLPLVAGAFVTATAFAALGLGDWGKLLFGAGLFSWVAIESVLLRRLYVGPRLQPALRPTLGLQLAPPAVGAVAYLNVSPEATDDIAYYLLGYALLQALLLIRMLPWIMEQPFAPSYWAFTFGAAAIGTVPLRMVERGDVGAAAHLAPPAFLAANLVVGSVAIGTGVLVARRLIPLHALPAREDSHPVTHRPEENRDALRQDP